MNMGYGQTFEKESLKDFLVEEAGLDRIDIRNVIVEENSVNKICCLKADDKNPLAVIE